jgi:Domain of unknown function (DUF6457)
VSISDRRGADQSAGAREWLATFAERLGVDAPDDATIDRLLDLAGVAAHASERMAAPIACYLVGLVHADPQQVLDAVSREVAGTGEDPAG